MGNFHRALAAAAMIAFAFIAAASADAAEESVVLLGRDYTLPLPDGYCPVDGNTESGKFFIDIQRDVQAGSGNVFLAGYIDCGQSARFEETGGVERYGLYVASGAPGQEGQVAHYPQFSREDFIDIMVGQIGHLDMAEIDSAANESLRDYDVEAQSDSLGVIRTDENGVYIGSIQKISTETETVRLAAVWYTTLIDGIVLHNYLYEEFRDADQFETLSAIQQDLAARLIANN